MVGGDGDIIQEKDNFPVARQKKDFKLNQSSSMPSTMPEQKTTIPTHILVEFQNSKLNRRPSNLSLTTDR